MRGAREILAYGEVVMSKKSKGGIIYNCESAKVYQDPEEGSPLVCNLLCGTHIEVNSAKGGKQFYGVDVIENVSGFVKKDYIRLD